jgi:alkylation response protein AidB-like acyl-CoA dehydrogenase
MDETAAVTPLTDLLAEIRERRETFEQLGHVPADMVEKLKSAGIYRAMVARRFGGDEMTPAEFCRIIEAISAADGSTGWVASFGSMPTYLAALPIETQQEIYAGGPDVVFALGVFPPQQAIRVHGGLKVNGRWRFGSGSTVASLFGVGIAVPEEAAGGTALPRMAVLPRKHVTVEENWNVVGLVATGSHDMVVQDVVVSDAWTFVRGATASLDTPLYQYPPLGLAAQVLAVVGLGIARAALDELAGRSSDRPSITGAPRLADRAYVHLELGKAEATLRSARAFFYETTEEAWQTLLAGDPLKTEQKALIRLAASHAAHTAAETTRIAYKLSGTAGIFTKHPLSRYLRDAMVVPQHAFLNESTFESAGRALLTNEDQPGFT